MSSIRTTQVDGDVAVGRNVNIGGKFTTQGSGHVKGGLKVDGWLEAKNVKAASKGMFRSVEELDAAYPNPKEGWWAIVGKSLPGTIYVGHEGAWTDTGGTGGNPEVDLDTYYQGLQTSIEEWEATVEDTLDNMEAGMAEREKTMNEQLKTMSKNIASLQASHVVLSESAYTALVEKDPAKLYLVYEDEEGGAG
ncbi:MULTISPECIES: hypothetical protein [Mediterranea]|uniref:hypothetical protein n=1 Tax=Mediterranea TaxID=1926659 RepID=UPI00201292BA|nr:MULTISPECIES: hypothetical protein [Mediterranea]MCL1606685.1 hypothetical protein [Mediterranea sp. ET5]MDM8122731.1 hypothetical protein [Mediterranea massiliensis]MDM8197187.1 hypothetical protein [Mediterranea massiliensis]